MLSKKVIDNIPFVMIITIFIIDFVFMMSIHSKWNATIEKYMPLKDKVVSLRYEITESHLWLEEAMGGDTSIDVENMVFPILKYDKFKKIILTLDIDGDTENRYKNILIDLKNIEMVLDNFYILAKQRWGDKDTQGIGSDSDQKFDDEFNHFLNLTDKTIDNINKQFNQELKNRDNYFIIILSIFFVVNIIVFIFLFKVRKNRLKLENELIESNKALEKHKEDLEYEVYQRTEELEESNEELQVSINNLNQTQKHMVEQEKMAALGGLVAGVAHEINTPVGLGITGITHFIDKTQKLKKSYEKEEMSEDDFQKYLKESNDLAEIIYTNLKRSADLVKSFKEISVDQTNEVKKEFNFKEYLEKILLSIHSKTKNKHMDINLDCSDLIVISSYPGVYAQIITNLIMNSMIHGFENKNDGKIDITVTYMKDDLSIVYKDNGKGIDKENIKKIFNPFFTTKRDEGGSGLGLNIIYNLITSRLNGTIECKSEIGKSTQFNIKIPLKDK